MVFETYYKTKGLSKELEDGHRFVLRQFLRYPGCHQAPVFAAIPKGKTQETYKALSELVRAGILVAHEPQFAVTPRMVRDAKLRSRPLHKVPPSEELIGHMRTFDPSSESVFHVEPSLVAAAHRFARY